MKRLTVLICLMIWASLCAFSQILNVPANHSTIQAAIDAASDGDTVLVAEGTYTENINFLGKAITVGSQFLIDGDTMHVSRTVIDGSEPGDPDYGSVVTFNTGEDSTSVLCGFAISGGSGRKIGDRRMGGGIYIECPGVKIFNNLVFGNHINSNAGMTEGSGIYAEGCEKGMLQIRNNTIRNNSGTAQSPRAGGIFVTQGSAVIDGNHILNNVLNGTGPSIGGGAFFYYDKSGGNQQEFVFNNNKISGNEANGNYNTLGGGVIFWLGYRSGGTYDRRQVQVFNNVISDNYSDGDGGGICAFWSNIGFVYNNTIINNISKGSGDNASIRNGSELVFMNNIVGGLDADYNNIVVESGTQFYCYNNLFPFGGIDADLGEKKSLNIFHNPEFEDENYTPAEGSVLVGRALDSLSIEDLMYYGAITDYDGDDRHSASSDQRPDIGAVESPYNRDPAYNTPTVIRVPDEQPTIQAGIDVATDGDTVLVMEDRYYENINFKGKAITVASAYILNKKEFYKQLTVIDGSQPSDPDSASVVTFCSGEDTTSIIQGFTITGGLGNSNSSLDNDPAISGGGVFVDSSGAKILHNIITNNHLKEAVGVGGCGIFARPFNDHSVVIRENDISNNSGYGSSAGGGGIWFLGDEIYIEGNTISENVLMGPACTGGAIDGLNWGSDGAKQVMIGNNLILENKVEATGYGRGGAMWLIHINKGEAYDLDRVHIYNNVVALNSVNGEVGGIGILSGSCGLLYNNTIFGNTATEKTSNLSIWESSFVLFNNIIWTEQAASMNMFQGSSPIFVKKNNSVNVPDYTWNIDSEPEFVEGSFRLVENNGCIGRGVDSLEAEGEWYYAPKIDMLGNPRKAHERIDLGAIESDFAHFDNLLITDTIINRADAGKCNGIATIYFEGGTPPFSFLIDEEENGTKSFSGLCAGTYELSVVDGDEKKASVTVTIEDITPGKEEVFSNQFADIKIYPNPASQMTTIRFGLEQQFPICLSILNILGQENMVLIREERNPGQHEVQFDASQLKSGIYFVRLVSDKISTCKLIVQ